MKHLRFENYVYESNSHISRYTGYPNNPIKHIIEYFGDNIFGSNNPCLLYTTIGITIYEERKLKNSTIFYLYLGHH